MTQKPDSSLLPVQETTLTWSKLSGYIKDKSIVQDCSGYCKPGQMLAIMGPSGAGKTSLLSMLAKKTPSSLKITGQVFANKTQFNAQSFYNFASFVFQNDILHQTLTVRQTLQFAAIFKIKDNIEALERVEQLLLKFSLKNCQNTYVGGTKVKGISGGQKKRVCIAVEMISKPSLLLLDEPTSGLDSYTAGNVLKILKSLSNQNKTIIFTIHQPSYLMYSSLDRLLLLHKGQTIYQGPADSVRNYLKSLSIQLPTKTTISDFFMMELSDYKAKNNKYQTPFNSENYEKHILKQIQNQTNDAYEEAEEGFQQIYTSKSGLLQIFYLVKRQYKIYIRNPFKAMRAIGLGLVMSFIIGMIFLSSIRDSIPRKQPPYDSMRDLIWSFIQIQNTTFIITTSSIFTSMFAIILVFPSQRQVFGKQNSSRMYDAVPYFISKLFAELPTLYLTLIIFSSCYWMMGYQSDAYKYFKFYFCICVLGTLANSIGMFLGTLFDKAQQASALSNLIILPLMMASGLYNKLNSIPVWISWLQYISPFKYGLHLMMLNQLEEKTYMSRQGIPYDYRSQLGIDMSFQANYLICIGLALFYYIISFILLKVKSAKIAA